MKNAFITANVRDVTDQYWSGQISFSKMVESFNIIAENHYYKQLLQTAVSSCSCNDIIDVDYKLKKCIDCGKFFHLE